MVMRRLLGQRSDPVPLESSRDFQRDASNLLAVFRFLAVAIVVTLTAVLETTTATQTSLVVLATIATGGQPEWIHAGDLGLGAATVQHGTVWPGVRRPRNGDQPEPCGL
jgi:hypothetical protein